MKTMWHAPSEPVTDTLSPPPYQQLFGATPFLTIREHRYTDSVHNLTSDKYKMVKEFSSLLPVLVAVNLYKQTILLTLPVDELFHLGIIFH